MDKQLERIEAKLDAMDTKLDNHLERIAQAEISITWLKWALSILLSMTGAVGLALTRYIEK